MEQGLSECNSVYEHLANFIKKIILKLSQKKARPPLGVALPRCERLGSSLLSLPVCPVTSFVVAPTAACMRSASQSYSAAACMGNGVEL